MSGPRDRARPIVGRARRCRKDLLQKQRAADRLLAIQQRHALPVGAARSRKTFVRFVASWRAAGKLRARATVFLHFRRNMNTDGDICTEERGSLREGVAALDAKQALSRRVLTAYRLWRL